MRRLHARSIKISVAVAACAALPGLLAAGLSGRTQAGSRATAEGWRFSVKPSCVLAHWIALAGSVSLAAFSGRRLMAVGAFDTMGWIGFLCGFAGVVLVLAAWPEALIFDREGVSMRGAAESSIRWENLSHVREYRTRSDHGAVLHSVYGRQLAIDGEKYDTARLLGVLLQHHAVPVLNGGEPLAPVTILQPPALSIASSAWASSVETNSPAGLESPRPPHSFGAGLSTKL